MFSRYLLSIYISFATVFVLFHFQRKLSWVLRIPGSPFMSHAALFLGLVVPFLLGGIHSSWTSVIVILNNFQRHTSWWDSIFRFPFQFPFSSPLTFEKSSLQMYLWQPLFAISSYMYGSTTFESHTKFWEPRWIKSRFTPLWSLSRPHVLGQSCLVCLEIFSLSWHPPKLSKGNWSYQLEQPFLL